MNWSLGAALIALVCLSTRSFCSDSTVKTYPVLDEVKDSPYSVTVNGRKVPIERAGVRHGAFYVRFQSKETAKVTVSAAGDAVSFDLRPERFRDAAQNGSGQVSFELAGPGVRFITATVDGKEQWPLLVICDANEKNAPSPTGARVINIGDYVKGRGIQTAGIQRALDDCAAKPGGGTVYFGPGIYRTGTIRIKDNTDVYLAPGALVVGSENPADYPVEPGRKEQGTHGPVCSFSRLIMFDHCKNSSLTGYGVIDGMGHIVRNEHKRHVQLVDVTDSTNIRIENVVLRNSAEWTLHILASRRVYVNNLKIINDWGVSNTDGIDPDGSRDVFIRGYIGYCGDDAVAIKTTGNMDLLRPASNIEITDSTVMTRKTSLKIGTETYADVTDVLFRNCDVVNSSRGIGLWVRDGGVISHVRFEDIRLDLREFTGEGMSGEPVRATVEKRNAIGKLKDVTFQRIDCKAPYRSIFAGIAESPIENITFKDCMWGVTGRTVKTDKAPVFDVQQCRDFVFENCKVRWLAEQPELWDGTIRTTDCRNVGDMGNG